MGNIVILAGSSRRGGNTDLLARAFAEGAEKRNRVELISVADTKVNPCIGCNSCAASEGNRCFQQDDMQAVYEKLAHADTVAVASPVYFYGLSAQLKAIVDRLHTPMRNRFPIKRLALLLAAADPDPAVFDAILAQYRMILDYFKLENAGVVLAPGVPAAGDIKGKRALDEAYELGSRLA